MRLLLAIFILLLAAPVMAVNDTFFVEQDGGGDYTSIETAIEDDAIDDSVSTAGDTIFILIREGWDDHDSTGFVFHGGLDNIDEGEAILYIKSIDLSRHSGAWCDTCHIWRQERTAQVMTLGEYSLEFDGVVFDWYGSNTRGMINSSSVDHDVRVYNCIVRTNNGRFYNPTSSGNLRFTAINTVFFEVIATGTATPCIAPSSGATTSDLFLYNNDFILGRSVTHSNASANDTIIVINNLFDSCNSGTSTRTMTMNITNGVGTFDIDYNRYDDSASSGDTSNGTNNDWNVVYTWEDGANADSNFHLASADTGAVDKGINLAFINDTLDFEGDPRAFSTFFGTADVPANQDAENGNDVTYINDEAASIGGTITQIEVYINSTSGTYDIGVFSKDGNDFTDVDSIATGITVVTGYNKFTAPADFSAMTINAGEYVGTFGQDTERSTTGASGFWFDNGGQIGNNSASTFTDAGGTVDIQLRVVIEIADGDPWDVGADEVVAAAAAAPSGRRRRVIMGSIDNKWKQDYTLEIPLWTTRNTFGLPY